MSQTFCSSSSQTMYVFKTSPAMRHGAARPVSVSRSSGSTSAACSMGMAGVKGLSGGAGTAGISGPDGRGSAGGHSASVSTRGAASRIVSGSRVPRAGTLTVRDGA